MPKRRQAATESAQLLAADKLSAAVAKYLKGLDSPGCPVERVLRLSYKLDAANIHYRNVVAGHVLAMWEE